MSLIDDIVALDLLTLREHTERAGDAMSADRQRASLDALLPRSEVCTVRRDGLLVAYAMLQRQDGGLGFVSGFGTHPAHRTATVMRDLLTAVVEQVQLLGLTELRSHVYRTNALSMAFHRRLGFRIGRENDRGVEFVGRVDALAASSGARRALRRIVRATVTEAPA